MVESAKTIRAALEASGYGRVSRQKFLDPSSNDVNISKGRRGLGGNTAVQHCCIISQQKIDEDIMHQIRQGNSNKRA